MIYGLSRYDALILYHIFEIFKAWGFGQTFIHERDGFNALDLIWFVSFAFTSRPPRILSSSDV